MEHGCGDRQVTITQNSHLGILGSRERGWTGESSENDRQCPHFQAEGYGENIKFVDFCIQILQFHCLIASSCIYKWYFLD